MEGHNEIHGTVSKQLTISGPFMMVQNKGSLSMSNVKLKPSMEFEIANRNWSGSLNAFDSKVSLSNVLFNWVKSGRWHKFSWRFAFCRQN